MRLLCAPVAQLDRVLPSEGRGRTFESSRARQIHFLSFRSAGSGEYLIASGSRGMALAGSNADITICFYTHNNNPLPMPNFRPYDALIVGGGHNGLTCACYLAGAGLRVRVLERRPIVGGAAVTEEFFPGFRNSTASYTVRLLHPKVIRELRLAEHGLRIIERPISNFLPLSDTQYLKIGGSLEATQAEVARYSRRDAERLPAYYAMLEGVADVLRSLQIGRAH